MIEQDLLKELTEMFVIRELTELQEKGELKQFVEFAKEEAKKDGMDTEKLMKTLDDIGKLASEDEKDPINWFKVMNVLENEKGLNCRAFKRDGTLLIENELMSYEECVQYSKDWIAPINLKTLNNALEPVGYQLGFLEAVHIPFETDGHSNFVRFEVKPL